MNNEILIFHEKMDEESFASKEIIKKIYQLNTEVEPINLEGAFKSIPEFNGYWDSAFDVASVVGKLKDKNQILVLTQRDIYFGNKSKEDDWIFAYNMGRISVVSGARLKGEDSQPRNNLNVSLEKYLKRIRFLTIHEIGHNLVNGGHMKPAKWINAKTNYEQDLGLHCVNNNCVMYEIVDIKTPKPLEGYMKIGDEKRFDAGLDETIERLVPEYLCNNCIGSISLE